MDSRVLLVPGGSRIVSDPTSRILHTYPNGDVLIQTSAPESESTRGNELAVHQGVQLPGVTDQALERARATLNTAEATRANTAKAMQRIAVPAGRESEPAQAQVLAYVELIGPVDPAWLSKLRELGVLPLQYHPENTYLSRGTRYAFGQAAQQSFVLHVTPLTSELKPPIDVPETGEEPIWIVVQGTSADLPAILGQLATLAGVTIDRRQEVDHTDSLLRIRARVTPDGQTALLGQPQVIRIEPFAAPTPEDEVADLIIAGQYNTQGGPSGSYLRWLEDHGLNGDGVTIGIVDNGVDVSHEAYSARIKDLDAGKKDWHATFVAGHAAGGYLAEKDGQNFIYGVGVAPAANLLAQDNQRAASALAAETITQAGPSGVTGIIQNNSWGTGTKDPMDYGSQEASYDRLVRNAAPDGTPPKPLVVCFSSGNSGKAGLTRPKAAKNIIVTGNSENYRPDVGAGESDNINEVFKGAHASSWGNCGDGRVRPDIVAPGEWTSSANYDSHPGEKEYISPKLTWGGGSSGASPKTAGSCALLTQWWRRHNNGGDPSPALLRALIVNGAVDTGSGGPVPNPQQGWGRLNLQNVVSEDVPRVYEDQRVFLTGRGQSKDWKLRVSDRTKPVRITLAWTDPPGPVPSGTAEASAIVNQLALRVQAGSALYRGNEFQNGSSVPANGPAAREGWDNLQNVFLPAGAITGSFTVSVVALNITTNCLTGQIDVLQQDFALVITNSQSDAASTPKDVAVVVDPAANVAPKPADPVDFHSTSSAGNTDAEDQGFGWWVSVDPAPAPATNTRPYPVPSDNADNWWLQGSSATKVEGERDRGTSPSAADDQLRGGLQAGFDVLAGSGQHRVVGGGGEPAPEDARERTDLLNSSVEVPLNQALAKLMSNWESFGESSPYAATIRGRVAVIVVGPGTRLATADLAALRRFAFHGMLYIVSTSADLLAFMAQRIHRLQGVQYRLASTDTDLPDVVTNALAEASGFQEVVVAASRRSTASLAISTSAFSVVSADAHLTIRVRYAQTAARPALELRRPGLSPIKLTASQRTDGVRTLERPGLLQIDLDAPKDGKGWSGDWAVLVSQRAVDGEAEPATTTVWTMGGPHLEFTGKEVAGSSPELGDQVLVQLRAHDDASLSRSDLAPRIIGDLAQNSAEAERDTSLVIQPSRLDEAGSGSHPDTEGPARPRLLGETVSGWLRLPSVHGGPLVVDVGTNVSGRDAGNIPFERRRRANLIRLEPRSSWRKRVAQNVNLVYTPATVIYVNRVNGLVRGLRLQKGNRQRDVTVTQLQLQRALADFNLESEREGDVLFGIVDRELVVVTRVLPLHTGPVAALVPASRESIAIGV